MLWENSAKNAKNTHHIANNRIIILRAAKSLTNKVRSPLLSGFLVSTHPSIFLSSTKCNMYVDFLVRNHLPDVQSFLRTTVDI